MKKYRRFPGWGCRVCALRTTGQHLNGEANLCYEKHRALGKRVLCYEKHRAQGKRVPCGQGIVVIPINCLLPDYNASDFPSRRAWYAEE